MLLIKLLKQSPGWMDDDTTIYVGRPWSCDAAAILVTPAPAVTESVMRDGATYDYFLETLIAREFLDDYKKSAEGSIASEHDRCLRLIRYAQDDA